MNNTSHLIASTPVVQSFSSASLTTPRYLSEQGQHSHRSHKETGHSATNSPSMQSRTSDLSTRDRRNYSRYTPYPGLSAQSGRGRSSSRASLSLDIPSLSIREKPLDAGHHIDADPIVLPPIHPPSQARNVTQSSYALPPISALEDLRGVSSHDSAAVLRRLQSDDDAMVGLSRFVLDSENFSFLS
jgi:hypothetical protein